MAFKRWIFLGGGQTAADALARELGLEPLTARVLAARGHVTAEAAERFLRGECPAEDPMLLSGMAAAVERIERAIENGERIEVFGDYDVDGITSTALLCDYLESSGADVGCSLPTREGDGYGLGPESVERMEAEGVSLIITVDNGISAYEAVERAGELGLDVIICDHHRVPAKLPAAFAVINPLQPGDPSSFKELAGVGVVLKLIAACEGCGIADIIEEYGAFTALGTVSDVMPLLGENRYIVKEGLERLRSGDCLGLICLAEAAGSEVSSIDARGIAFVLAPRLNAAGRMGDAAIALELLRTEDPDRALELANELCELNSQRQQAEREMTALVEGEIASDPSLLERPLLIFASERYNSGVAGIVCSRLSERYGKPAIIITVSGSCAKGSGRSIRGFSLYDAISACSERLIRFGGHDLAAGFTLMADDIEFFKKQLFDHFGRTVSSLAFQELSVECVTDFSELSERAVSELGCLAPFGCGNEEPVFATLGATIVEITRLGDRHSRITLQKDGVRMAAALFGRLPTQIPFSPGQQVDVAYTLSIYASPRGGVVSLKLRGLRPAGFSDSSLQSLGAYLAYRCGSMAAEAQRASFAPDRKEVAEVFRELRREPIGCDLPERAVYRFPNLAAGKTTAAIDILKELGFIKNENGRLCVVEDAPRRELGESGLFARLRS